MNIFQCGSLQDKDVAEEGKFQGIDEWLGRNMNGRNRHGTGKYLPVPCAHYVQ